MKVLFRQLGVFLFCASLSAGAIVQAQAPRKKAAAKKPSAGTVAAKPKASTSEGSDVAASDEKSRFDAAIAAATPSEKAELLVRFIADFPRSSNKQRAQESLASARAAMADQALTAGNNEQALKLFRVAVDEAPKPYSDRLFAEVISTIPANLYWKGSRAEAYEIARAIEANVATDARRLAGVANFYLSVEDGTEAKRIAETLIKLDETSPAGYMVLGMAQRLNFELVEAEKAFAKALELDAGSAQSKRMLAEMKRALGKSEEATTLYQEILAKDENDTLARTGYVLSLFDAGKRSEAEVEFAKALERTPGNVFLLAGAAYWYAANNDGVRAAELAQQAIAKEPRFIWSHIALARGLTVQGKPVDAEQALVTATKYGNFPTVQYEIAAARFAAGFYREAAEELKKSFTIDSFGLHSKLGGRIDRTGNNFSELLSYERRASIFTPAAADSAETAEQLKALFELHQALAAEKPDETKVVAAADRFTAGSDQMATYRRLYAAQKLNEKQLAAGKALEYSTSAIATVDNALSVATPGAAVMAAELYEARNTAFANNDFLLIPEVPKQTLSAILRGRIEESTGVALLHAGNPADATVRFRRALSVVPKDSAWWRSATWNLGRSLEAEGKDEEALRAYVASYRADKPNLVRYLRVSTLYKKVKGSDEGLADAVGPNPLDSTVAGTQPAPVPESSPVEDKPAAVTDSGSLTKPLPRTLPVADTKPIETTPGEAKPVDTKVETATETADPKPAEVKPEETKPSEEKKAEPLPGAEAPAEPKQPDATPSEVKPVDVKKDVPADEKKEPQPEPAAEVKKEPVAESSEKPVEEVPKAEVKKEVTSDAPAEPKPAEARKEEPADVKKDAPVEDVKGAPKEATVDTPKETKPAEPEPEKKEPAPEPVSKPDPDTGRSEVKDETPKPIVEEPKPVAADTKSDAERPRRFEVVKTDLTIPPPRSTRATPSQRTASSNRTAARPDPMRPLFEPVVISVPGGSKDANGRVSVSDLTKRCSVGVSQDEISINGEDGTVAVLVSVDEGVDIAAVKGTSNSDEIAVRREPRIAGIDDRIVYVLSSATGRPGMYQVTFAAPCGRKTITVRIR